MFQLVNEWAANNTGLQTSTMLLEIAAIITHCAMAALLTHFLRLKSRLLGKNFFNFFSC